MRTKEGNLYKYKALDPALVLWKFGIAIKTTPPNYDHGSPVDVRWFWWFFPNCVGEGFSFMSGGVGVESCLPPCVALSIRLPLLQAFVVATDSVPMGRFRKVRFGVEGEMREQAACREAFCRCAGPSWQVNL